MKILLTILSWNLFSLSLALRDGYCESPKEEAQAIHAIFDGSQGRGSQDAPVAPVAVGHDAGHSSNHAPSPHEIEHAQEKAMENYLLAQQYHSWHVKERKNTLISSGISAVSGGLSLLAQYSPLLLTIGGYATGALSGIGALALLMTLGSDSQEYPASTLVLQAVIGLGLGVVSILSFLNPVTAGSSLLAAGLFGGAGLGVISGIGAIIDLFRSNNAVRRFNYWNDQIPAKEGAAHDPSSSV
ncbi:MAG: hypothetical protein HY547_07105 [Elusimicrobia bacterium]|nr:hypothetical protein [Elusimicrobiota bacterium]